MGVMRFLIADDRINPGCDESLNSYISGFDGRVFPTRCERTDAIMECTRQHSDSGRLHVPWPVDGFGTPVVSTTSLREREEPYLLPLELARGKIAQLRNQLSDWEVVGLRVPEELMPVYREAHHHFARAVTIQDDVPACSNAARSALSAAFRAAQILTLAYADQRQNLRRLRVNHVPVLLGCEMGQFLPDGESATFLVDAFNSAQIPVNWRIVEPVEGQYHWDELDAQVDWCIENRLLPSAGPLLDLSPGGLPEWLWTWQHDFLNLQSFVCDFVETAISHYQGKIRLWEVSARGNTGGALTLSEENRLSLVARTLEIARQTDEEIQLMIRIDDPWGAYQARGLHRLSPLQFVDALVRSGVGLTRINLEIAVGFLPRSSGMRDILEFSRLIDLWSSLGVPLQVTMAFPSAATPDRLANPDFEVSQPVWRETWSPEAQAEWVKLYLPVLMSKPSVMAVSWSHLSDGVAHRFPNSGLLYADGSPKPVVSEFHQLQATWNQTS